MPHLGAQPPAYARALISSKRASWAAMEGWPGSSAQAKWDQRPVTVTSPSRSACRARSTRSAQSAGWQPLRPRPVSALSWILAVRPVARAASVTSASAHGSLTDMSRSASIPSRQGPPGVQSQHMTRARSG